MLLINPQLEKRLNHNASEISNQKAIESSSKALSIKWQ